jgi:hypothetical protein
MKMKKIMRHFSIIICFGVSIFVIHSIIATSGSCDSRSTSDVDIQDLFTPSGWMGDGVYGNKYINFSESNTNNPHSPPTCIKIIYTFGPKRWGGVYWQNKADNWGDEPGNNYAGKGFTKVSFWARGETGKEVVEFKSGNIKNSSKKFYDSFGETAGRVSLTKDWKQYSIDLTNSDLTSVIGGFCWVANSDYNSGSSITFYIDDIVLQ